MIFVTKPQYLEVLMISPKKIIRSPEEQGPSCTLNKPGPLIIWKRVIRYSLLSDIKYTSKNIVSFKKLTELSTSIRNLSSDKCEKIKTKIMAPYFKSLLNQKGRYMSMRTGSVWRGACLIKNQINIV